jgi:hypothetical protein
MLPSCQLDPVKLNQPAKDKSPKAGCLNKSSNVEGLSQKGQDASRLPL